MKKIIAFLAVFSLISAPSAQARSEKLYLMKDDFISSYKALVMRTAPLYRSEIWVVEYGVGCLSMWLKEGNFILATYSTFLDGIGGKLTLPGKSQSCRIWDAWPIEDVTDDFRDEDWEWLSENGFIE